MMGAMIPMPRRAIKRESSMVASILLSTRMPYWDGDGGTGGNRKPVLFLSI
jgi:hypothetical protein